MLKYISIDLETTGLDPDQHQIIEMAAIYDFDPSVPVELLPTFHAYVRRDCNYCGSAYALAMNSDILSVLAKGTDPEIKDTVTLWDDFQRWLDKYDVKLHFTPAGKNFGSFDAQFLLRAGFDKIWTHRTLDPGCLYLSCDDTQIPSTRECCKRAGVAVGNHRAVDDARCIINLIRVIFGGHVC